MQNNRRKSERVTVSLEVELESSSGKREVRISDLSRDGCFVDSISIINNHENVWLRIRTPVGDWIGVSGEVVSVFPGIGFGVRFTPASREDRGNVEQLVQLCGGKLSPEPEPAGAAQASAESEPQQKNNSLHPGGASFNEFEKFVDDLLDEDDRDH